MPERVAAQHVNMAPGGATNPMEPVEGLDDAQAAQLDRLRQHGATAETVQAVVRIAAAVHAAAAVLDGEAVLKQPALGLAAE